MKWIAPIGRSVKPRQAAGGEAETGLATLVGTATRIGRHLSPNRYIHPSPSLKLSLLLVQAAAVPMDRQLRGTTSTGM